MGLLEFATQAEHHRPRPHIQPLQLRIGHRRLGGPVTHDRLGVGGDLLERLLLLELGGVLLVDLAERGAGGADGLGGGGQRRVVGCRCVVGVPHLVDEFVELGEVCAGGGAGRGRPGFGEAATVFLEAAEVNLGEVADLAPAGDLLPVVCGVVVLEARPHAVDVHQLPVGEA
ncbi:hypothetical protein ACWD6L_22035 [Micromonospora profundi]